MDDSLLDSTRLKDVVAVGTIGGGDVADVLAVQYRGEPVRLRIRLEATNHRLVFEPSGDMNAVIKRAEQLLAQQFPGAVFTSRVRIGRRARQWLTHLDESLAKQIEASGDLPPNWVIDRDLGVAVRPLKDQEDDDVAR